MEQLKNNQEVQVTVNHSQKQSLITIQVPESETRTPSDVCLVIDTSGSMGCEATMKNNTGKTESYGLNQLDLVKHAAKTVIMNLQPCDRLSIVEFSSHAKVVYKLGKMDENGQKEAIKKLEALQDNGSTNLWEGLETGLEELRKNSGNNRNQALFLLTDGQPNDIPKGGNVFALETYKKKYEQFHCIINTYGFGYSLQSEELNQLALIGGGAYGFIPDSSLVGSIFINALSNFLSIADHNVSLNLEAQNGAQFAPQNTIVGYNYITPSWGVQVNLEQLLYGQKKQVIVNLELPADFNENTEYLVCKVAFNGNKKLKDKVQKVQNQQIEQDIQKQLYRVEFIEAIDKSMQLKKQNKDDEAQKLVQNLITKIKSESLKTDKYVAGLIQDLEGQVAMALSKAEFYNKWGIHFLPSLQRTHQIQQCNNFKDAGVQNYGGQLFQKLRDQADETFNKLPPPKPSIHHPEVQQLQNMQVYNDPYGGCVGGDTLVQMFDGRLVLAKNIKKGDIVLSANNQPAKIRAAIQINITKGRKNLVELEGGLIITPWHPIRINNQWQFPCYLGATVERKIDSVFNFVLDSQHVMIINGIECVSLGHNFKGDVIEHSYFGSQLVIDDLSTQEGWDEGFVKIKDNFTQRNQNSKLITSMITNTQNISTLI